MAEKEMLLAKFCFAENLSVKTFSCWHKKYKKEKGFSIQKTKETPHKFIPVKVSGGRSATLTDEDQGRIEVSFRNRMQLSCPVGTDIGQLKSLINF